MTEFSIKSALNSQLNNFLEAYPIDVKYDNVKYSPTRGTDYLEVYFLAGDKFQKTLGTPALNRVNGIYQIDINVEGATGEKKVVEIVDALDVFFKRGTKIIFIDDKGETVNVKILNFRISKKIVQDDPSWYSKTMNVRWRSDILN